MKKFILLSIFFTGFYAQVFSQKVSGLVKEEDGKLNKGATVSLLRAADSVAVKYSAIKENGYYEFLNTEAGQYLVSVSHVGYNPVISTPVTVTTTDVALDDIILTKLSAELQTVTVTSSRPMVEVKADKTILNVEGTINAVGSDALELLRKSPGVLVDRDDNLSLSGKNGVQVYIDGRPTPLSGKDLADYLKTLQSAQVEAIEIITNPSAKYEAAGNAGIINIRLKKNKSFGTNGSVNAGWAVGTYPKYNAGLSLNNRNKSANIFGTYNFNKSKNLNSMHFYRELADSVFDQRNRGISDNLNHNYKVGADFFLSKRSTLGVIINGSVSDNEGTNQSITPVRYKPTGGHVKTLVADNRSEMSRNNTNFNVNYRRVDSSNRELNLDADYGRYRIETDQYQPNIYFNPFGIETSSEIYNMLAPSEIDLYSFKADYEQDFKKGKLGIGGRFAYVSTDNDFRRFDVHSGTNYLDSLRSNRFDYTENINAVYLNYNRAFKGFMFQFGLRAENTTSKGHSTGFKDDGGSSLANYDSTFKRSYTDLFPSIAFTFNKNPMSQFGLTFSRRIDRPTYQDLNPFEFKLDVYTFQRGNTQLRPQYTNSFGITHTYKFKLNTALNYSHVEDIFAQLIDTAEISKSFISKQNLATQDIVSLNISYPFQYKSYSAFLNFNSHFSKYKANFGEGRKVDLDVFAFNIYGQQSIKFKKTWTAELSGWYTSPSIYQGTFESRAMGGLDMGVQKVILKGKGNLKVSYSDILNTMQWSGESNFAGQYFRASGQWESQQIKVNFSYRFGNAQVKAARQRKSAIEEEAKRTQGSGGIGQ